MRPLINRPLFIAIKSRHNANPVEQIAPFCFHYDRCYWHMVAYIISEDMQLNYFGVIANNIRVHIITAYTGKRVELASRQEKTF